MTAPIEHICQKWFTEQRLTLLDNTTGYDYAKQQVDQNINLFSDLCELDALSDQTQVLRDPRLFDLNTQDCLCHLQGLWLRIFYNQKDKKHSRYFYIYRLLQILIIDQEEQQIMEPQSLYQQNVLRVPQRPQLNNLKNLISLLKSKSFQGKTDIQSEQFKDIAQIVFNFANNMANYLIIEDLLKIYRQSQYPKQLNTDMNLDKEFEDKTNWFQNQSNLGVWTIPFYESYQLALVVIESLRLPIRFIYHSSQQQKKINEKQETQDEIVAPEIWKKSTFYLEDYKLKDQTSSLIVELYEKKSGQPLNESNYKFDDFYNDLLEIAINHQQHKNKNQVASYDPKNHCFRGSNSQAIIQRINSKNNQSTLGLINLFDTDTSLFQRVPRNLFHIYFVANEEAFYQIFTEIPTEILQTQEKEKKG